MHKMMHKMMHKKFEIRKFESDKNLKMRSCKDSTLTALE